MKEKVIKIFDSYMSDNTNNHSYNYPNNIDIEFLSYHKIDMIYYDYLERNHLTFPSELASKKQKIIVKNAGYLSIAKQLSQLFNRYNIKHVFLKGISCMLSIYKENWHRYFHDIDLLVDKNDLHLVESILLELGYIYGKREKDTIVPASRNQILFQRAFTHELYNMCRIEKDGWVSNIDVNFLFSWKGINEIENENTSISELYDHIISVHGLFVFDKIINMMHLCCHLYNEAVYFLLDKEFHGGDPKEIQLNRILDIVLLSKKFTENDFNELFVISKKYGLFHKVIYSILLVNHLLNLRIANGLIKEEEYPNFNEYYTPNKEVAFWPISVDERVFSLTHKKEITAKMFLVE